MFRIVANKSFGLFNKLKAFLLTFSDSFFNNSFSVGSNEKKATSDAEIKAEQVNNNRIVKSPDKIGNVKKEVTSNIWNFKKVSYQILLIQIHLLDLIELVVH